MRDATSPWGLRPQTPSRTSGPAPGGFAPHPPAGASPLHPTPFSLLRQRKGGKRKAGLLRSPARPAAKRVPCVPAPAALSFGRHKPSTGRFESGLSARQGGHAQNSLRSLRSLRSNKLRESDHDVRLRRTAPLSALLGGADGGQQPTAEPRAVDCRQRADVRYSAVRSPTPSAPPRSTASRPACRGHATPLTRPACLSRVSGANAASSGRGRLASTAGNPSPQARGERSAGPPFFSPLFFGGAKKRGPGAGPEVLLRGPGAEGPRMGCTA
jgi:hypothetical protein